MTPEGPSQREVDEAFEYLRELRRNPAEFERWADMVVKGWLRKKGKTSGRRSKVLKRF